MTNNFLKARRKNKERLSSYRTSCYCKWCGKRHTNESKIEFHRVEDVIKLHDAVRKYSSWEKIKEVLDGCIQLCPHCHRLMHETDGE